MSFKGSSKCLEQIYVWKTKLFNIKLSLYIKQSISLQIDKYFEIWSILFPPEKFPHLGIVKLLRLLYLNQQKNKHVFTIIDLTNNY